MPDTDTDEPGLPDVIGECDECRFKIHRGSVEERVSLLAQEGENADIDDVARDDARSHARVCSGSIEWADEWGIEDDQNTA